MSKIDFVKQFPLDLTWTICIPFVFLLLYAVEYFSNLSVIFFPNR